jgi:predicted flavoprotein YhiN
LKQFTPRGIAQRFVDHGVPLKTEEDMRVFPVSDDGDDIVGVFEQIFSQDNRIRVCLKEGVQAVARRECSDGRCSGFIVTTDKNTMIVDRLIITT